MTEKREIYTDAQKRLIASLLYDSDKINRTLEIVTADDFEEPSYHLIFSSMVNVTRKDQRVSIVSVANDLEETGNLKNSGGTSELYSLRELGRKYLLEATPELYAAQIRKGSIKSKVSDLIEISKPNFVDDSGVSAKEGISELISNLNDELNKLSDATTMSDIRESIKNYDLLLEERKATYEANKEIADGLQGIPSNIPSLNKYTTGWRGGQIITIAARTGIGKSVFAVNSAVTACSAGKTTLFFSLEMSEEEINDRVVASVSGVPMYRLHQGTLRDDEKELVSKGNSEIAEMKLIIESEPELTIDAIRAKALKIAQSETGLDLIIIDYLQLITPTSKNSNRQVEVAAISRAVKILAKQLEIPIMVLVQANREKSNEESRPPRIDDIRESGAIAQDSSVVILLHREKAEDSDTIPKTQIILGKNRNGVADRTIWCHSNLECSTFRESIKAKDIDNDEIFAELEDDADFDELIDIG